MPGGLAMAGRRSAPRTQRSSRPLLKVFTRQTDKIEMEILREKELVR